MTIQLARLKSSTMTHIFSPLLLYLQRTALESKRIQQNSEQNTSVAPQDTIGICSIAHLVRMASTLPKGQTDALNVQKVHGAPTTTQPHHAPNAKLGPTQINQVPHPALNALLGPALVLELPSAQTVLEERLVKRDNFAPIAQKEPMRNWQDHPSVHHAMLPQVLRRVLIGATNVRLEVLLVATKRSADCVLKTFILILGLQKIANAAPLFKLLVQVLLVAHLTSNSITNKKCLSTPKMTSIIHIRLPQSNIPRTCRYTFHFLFLSSSSTLGYNVLSRHLQFCMFYITLHYTILHYTTLHYTTLHYTVTHHISFLRYLRCDGTYSSLKKSDGVLSNTFSDRYPSTEQTHIR